MVDKIKDLLEIRFSETDLEHCFTIDVKLEKSKKLLVFVDSDTGISYKECVKISRYLEAEIEERKWLPENYRIDVSSPGADRPLSNKRQYKKHIGRELDVKYGEEEVYTGELMDILEDHILLKNDKSEEIKLEFDRISESSVKIKFK